MGPENIIWLVHKLEITREANTRRCVRLDEEVHVRTLHEYLMIRIRAMMKSPRVEQQAKAARSNDTSLTPAARTWGPGTAFAGRASLIFL